MENQIDWVCDSNDDERTTKKNDDKDFYTDDQWENN